MLHKHEIFDCVVYEENLYRETEAPDADDLYCANPYETHHETHHEETHEEETHLEDAPCGCEVDGETFCNFDYGETGFCESCDDFDSVEHCYNDGLPDAGAEDCHNRCFHDEEYHVEESGDEECNGCWSCYEIDVITEELVQYYDTNDDGVFDHHDTDYHDMQEAVEYCDQNGDAALHYYEIYDCIVDVENEYREENAPEASELVCENPYEVVAP